MADYDIDIEEHDVLENPAIKSIFPDISIVKKEISQYFEDAPNIKQEPELINTESENNVADRTPPLNTADAKDTLSPRKPSNGISDNTCSTAAIPAPRLQSNKIILGTKPTKTTQCTEVSTTNKDTAIVKLPKLVLIDLSSYLDCNDKYCQDCHRLFPHKTDIEEHIRRFHTIKTINKQADNEKNTLQTEQNMHKCNNCNNTYSYSWVLKRHYKTVHRKKVTVGNSNSRLAGALQSVNHKCVICKTSFYSNQNLKRHYKNIHKKIVTSKSKFTKKTATRVALMKKITQYERKPKYEQDKCKAGTLCFHCKKPFPDQKSLIDHIYKVLDSKNKPSTSQTKTQVDERNDSKNMIRKSTINRPKILKTNAHNMNSNKNIDSSASRTVNKKITNRKVTKRSIPSQTENEDLYTTSSRSTRYNLTKKLATKRASETAIEDLDTRNSKTSKNELTKKVGPKRVSETPRNKLTNKVVIKRTIPYGTANEDLDATGARTFRKRNIMMEDTRRSIGFQDAYDDFSNPQSSSKTHSNKLTKKEGSQRTLYSNGNVTLSGSKTFKNKSGKKENQKRAISSEENVEHQSDENDNDKTEGPIVYECTHCSYYVPSVKAYYGHMVGRHKIEKVSRVNKATFNKQCKYCPSQSFSSRSHNSHIYNYHNDLLYKEITTDTAPRNFEEKQKNKLGKTFKNPMFKKYASFVLNSIIYKCKKCDIHFLSSQITRDHEKHMELLVNWKCSICRRIFKKHDKYLHMKQHSFSQKFTVYEFNELEYSRLLYNCTKCAIHFTEDRYLEHYPNCDVETTDSAYCKTCDILVDKHGMEQHEYYHNHGKNDSDFTIIASDIITEQKKVEDEGVKKRKRLHEQHNCLTFCNTCKCYLSDMALARKAHIESRCSEIPKFTCNLCGLVLTNKALGTHRQHHKEKSLKLQDFKFFDLNGMQINPPIPEYPHCNNCDVHFVSKNGIKNHICSEIEYLTCDVCNIKLTERAYKLHMTFHSYSLTYTKETTSQKLPEELPQLETKLKGQKKTNPSFDATSKNDQQSDENLTDDIVYTCKSCNISVDMYDQVVEHCQNHFDPQKTHSVMKVCTKCSLKFDVQTFEKHQQFHKHNKQFKYLEFDPQYFASEQNIWIKHVFASISQETRNKIISKSVYRHEGRIKMEVVQKGPLRLTVYKCDKCGCCIEPNYIFSHIKNTCTKVRRHPCSACGLPFIYPAFRSKHEKLHKQRDNLRIKSFNIVLINCDSHKDYHNNIFSATNQYILYQCRSCDGIVDKSLFASHQCSIDNLRKCSKCGLLLYKKDFDKHVAKHSELARFNSENIKVVLFGNNDEDFIDHKTLRPSFNGMVCDYKLYKCWKCQLCVKDEESALTHVCASAKWKCPKCGFFFTVHRLRHHMNMHVLDPEFQIDNIKVIMFGVPDMKSTKNETDINDTVETFSTDVDEKVQPQMDTDSSVSLMANDKNNDSEETTVKLYKCTCGLHFVDSSNVNAHSKDCGPKSKVIKQNCSKCSLVFNPKELFSHLIAHHGDKNKKYNFEIIETSPKTAVVCKQE